MCGEPVHNLASQGRKVPNIPLLQKHGAIMLQFQSKNSITQLEQKA